VKSAAPIGIHRRVAEIQVAELRFIALPVTAALAESSIVLEPWPRKDFPDSLGQPSPNQMIQGQAE